VIIATTQDLIEAGACGCPCEVITCPVPREECESVSVDACGFLLPAHEDLPPEHECLLFRKKADTRTLLVDYTESTGGGGTLEIYDSENSTVTRWKRHDGESCAIGIFSTVTSDTQTITEKDSGGELIVSNTAVESSSSGIGAACSGTYSYTSLPDDSGDTSGAWDNCPSFDYSPDGSWSYAGYSYTIATGASGDADGLETRTVTFSEIIDVAALQDDLDRIIALIDPEESWPGTACASEVTIDRTYTEPEPPEDPALVCEQVSGATQARIRVGVPEGFSTVEAPRSVFEVQFDLVEFPEGWDATIDDPEYEAPDPLPDPPPPVPQIPDPAAPQPILRDSHSWVWNGNMETPWSEWFVIPLPSGPGEVRRVNTLVKCYNSTRLGTVPTAHGEQAVIEEPPP